MRSFKVYKPFQFEDICDGCKLLVLTDAELHLNIMSATTVLDNLIAEKKIPPIIAVFIDAGNNRMKELKCNDDFARFVSEELVPWTKKTYKLTVEAIDSIIGGLSLGGLMATYLGLKSPEIFGNVLAQSGDFSYQPDGWQSKNRDTWIASQYRQCDKLSLKFYLNNGIIERKEIIDSNQNLLSMLKDLGYEAYFETFKGGHDYLSWSEYLATGLIYLIG